LRIKRNSKKDIRGIEVRLSACVNVFTFSLYCHILIFFLYDLSLSFLLLCSYFRAAVLLSLFIRLLLTIFFCLSFSLYIDTALSVPPVPLPLSLPFNLFIYIYIYAYSPSVSLSLSLGCTGSGIRGLGPLFCVLSRIGHRLFLRC
jgi:hypothetical protein